MGKGTKGRLMTFEARARRRARAAPGARVCLKVMRASRVGSVGCCCGRLCRRRAIFFYIDSERRTTPFFYCNERCQ